ncbi:hypothetical protein ACE1ET_16590 [Saccharicrinis sp. FJH62]|uniref:hypothetical protein n=1 Tax=Saccharicrinis sp. FJH62 TaxID=3344657 RepID=UPI0035D42227
MILIADSGSTKTSWAVIAPNDVKLITTPGINPALHHSHAIESVIQSELLPALGTYKNKIDLVAFYGAGCNTYGCKILSDILRSVFNCEIGCNSDLAGSAIATIGKDEGIVSILGTGSNSGLFINGTLKEHVPSLGYILGDEGSGSYLGKQLLADFFKKQLPQKLAIDFENLYHPIESEVISAVYRNTKPNQYLASFVPFIVSNITTEYCHNLVKSSFIHFFERNICSYTDYQNYPLSFTGSVAFGFRKILHETAEEFGMKTIHILQNPIEGMIHYYKQQL